MFNKLRINNFDRIWYWIYILNESTKNGSTIEFRIYRTIYAINKRIFEYKSFMIFLNFKTFV